MFVFARLALTLVAALAAFIGGYWLPGALLAPYEQRLAAGGLALLVAAIVWLGSGSRSVLMRGAVLGAGWGGMIGFVGGFFGPMLFAPDANQGPMLGLFITGPGGVALGALAGLAIAAGKPG